MDVRGGGLSTKLHLVCEQGRKPLSLVVTAGQRGDPSQFEAVMAGIRVARVGGGHPATRPERVRGDKAYSSRASRAHLRRRGIAATIPEPADPAPAAPRGPRWPAARVRSGRSPRAPRRAVRHQPAQTPSRGRRPVRQAHRPLPGRHRPHHRHQRMALINFETGPRRRSAVKQARRS
ncbi:transposase [Actinomadura nitritigenes]|uniref:Transposase n=1 Tax=Actinomadura nitritigenes TaxID=134602 RepID=A0ABS3RF57_9ACTN|nr:transposase [Actinomadura nitritigenes]